MNIGTQYMAPRQNSTETVYFLTSIEDIEKSTAWLYLVGPLVGKDTAKFNPGSLKHSELNVDNNNSPISTV